MKVRLGEKAKSIKRINSSEAPENNEGFRESFLFKYSSRKIKNIKAEIHKSEIFSEISGAFSEKSELKDANAPLSFNEKLNKKINNFLSYFKVHKSPSDERARIHINPKYLLWILCILCVGMIIASSVSETFRAPFKAIASVLVVPAQKGINSIGSWFSDNIKTHKTIEELEAECEALQQQIDNLTILNTALTQQNIQADRLIELLDIDNLYSSYEMTGANIIAKNSDRWFSTFTIDKGSKDGIKKDMNVMAQGGLVGIVTDVGYNFATVRAIVDDESSVSAKFISTSDLCIINGSLELMSENLLSFSNVSASVSIEDNTAVVTSQVSSKYLPGLLIGYVYSHQLDANDLTQSGFITPVVDFTNLEQVMVILDLKEDYE